MARRGDVKLVAGSDRLRRSVRVEPVAPLIHDYIATGGHVIVEGTQGFGLSLLHSEHYPNVTSRDTTAAAFCMEVGISPRLVDEIILVVRTYPIRVGGESGPIFSELTWDDVQRESGAPTIRPEFTSVTGRLRRVGRFDIDLVRSACQYNQPTSLAVMGIDRLDYANHRCEDVSQLSDRASHFLDQLCDNLGLPIVIIGTGFDTHDALRIEKPIWGHMRNV